MFVGVISDRRQLVQRPVSVMVYAWLVALTASLVVGECGLVSRSPRAAQDSATDMTYVRDCNQTVPVSLHVFNEVLVHKRLDGGENDEEKYKFQCFLHCLFTKYGWVS